MRITRRRAVAILVIVLTFCSLSLLASDYEFKTSDERPRELISLDGFGDGPEVGVIIELAEAPMLERKAAEGARTAAAIDSLIARLEVDIRNIEGRTGTRRPAANSLRETVLERRYKLAFAGASARVSRASINAIRALPYVKAVHPDMTAQAHLVKSVPKINAPQVWEQYKIRGRGVVIAVIDTGIDYNHPALGQGFGPGFKVLGGWDFVNNDGDPMDDYGHGTHVAGIAAGNSDKVRGVAPEASLLAFKALDAKGSGKFSDIVAAIELALDPNGDGDFSDRPHIVNMSLGGPALWDDPIIAAVERVVDAGIVMVLSAGNDRVNGAIGTPAAAPSAITVGATITDTDRRASFSSRGPAGRTWAAKPEVAAPGFNITSAYLKGATIKANGTSMAAPHVAGAAALILEKHPTWTPEEVKAAIVSSANPVLAHDSNEEETQYPHVLSAGVGRIDVKRAIESTILPSPAALSFGLLMKHGEPFTAVRTVRLTNRGSEAETLTFKAPALPKGASLTIAPETLTIAKDETAELTLTLKLDAVAPSPNEDQTALTGLIEVTGTKTSLRLAWLAINSHVLHVTVGGQGKVSALLVGRQHDPALWSTGPRSFGAFVREELNVLTYFEPENEAPRLVVNELVPLSGYKEIPVEPSDARFRIDIAGADERGVPFATFAGPGTDTPISIVPDLFLLDGYFPVFLPRWDREQPLWVSPLSSTWLRFTEAIIGKESRYAAMLPVLRSVSDHVTLGTRAGDWAGQTIEHRCETNCTVNLSSGGGDIRIHPAWEIQKGSGTWKLFLTQRVDDWWDFRAHVQVREEGVPSDPRTSGVNPWTYITSSLRNQGGKFTVSPFNRVTTVDYIHPNSQAPLTIGGEGLPVLRTVQGTRELAFEPFEAALGGLFGLAGRTVKARMWDSTGAEVALLGGSFVGDYRLPRDMTGVYRFETTMDYKIAGRNGRVTQSSSIEFEKSHAAPTLTMLRIEDGAGTATNTLTRNGKARLFFSARHSSLTDNFYVFHFKVDPAATRAWWRPHGTTEWLPLSVSTTGEDYAHRGEMPGTAGTLFAADLQAVTAVSGAIDLKVSVATRFNGQTEVVYAPALVVNESQPRRRAVR